jgi:hypothetical protein
MTAAAALAAAPIAAQAAPPRVAAPVAESEELGGGMILPIAILLGLVVVIYLAIDSEEDIDVPFSP